MLAYVLCISCDFRLYLLSVGSLEYASQWSVKSDVYIYILLALVVLEL